MDKSYRSLAFHQIREKNKCLKSSWTTTKTPPRFISDSNLSLSQDVVGLLLCLKYGVRDDVWRTLTCLTHSNTLPAISEVTQSCDSQQPHIILQSLYVLLLPLESVMFNWRLNNILLSVALICSSTGIRSSSHKPRFITHTHHTSFNTPTHCPKVARYVRNDSKRSHFKCSSCISSKTAMKKSVY